MPFLTVSFSGSEALSRDELRERFGEAWLDGDDEAEDATAAANLDLSNDVSSKRNRMTKSKAVVKLNRVQNLDGCMTEPVTELLMRTCFEMKYCGLIFGRPLGT